MHRGVGAPTCLQHAWLELDQLFTMLFGHDVRRDGTVGPVPCTTHIPASCVLYGAVVATGRLVSSEITAMVSKMRDMFTVLVVLAAVVGAIDFPDRYTAQANRDDNSRHMGFDHVRSTNERSDMHATLRDNFRRHERFSSGLEVFISLDHVRGGGRPTTVQQCPVHPAISHRRAPPMTATPFVSPSDQPPPR